MGIGSTNAHTAAMDVDVSALLKIAETDPGQLHAVDTNGWKPIHEAARADHPAVIALLVNYGADVNDRTLGGKGGSPLHCAREEHGHDYESPMIELLLSLGAEYIEPLEEYNLNQSYDDSSSDINSSSSSSTSNSEDDDDGSDDSHVFIRSNLKKEYNDDEDDIMIEERENVMDQLISTGVECTSSSLVNDAENKTEIIQHDMQTEDVRSNGRNADSIGVLHNDSNVSECNQVRASMKCWDNSDESSCDGIVNVFGVEAVNDPDGIILDSSILQVSISPLADQMSDNAEIIQHDMQIEDTQADDRDAYLTGHEDGTRDSNRRDIEGIVSTDEGLTDDANIERSNMKMKMIMMYSMML